VFSILPMYSWAFFQASSSVLASGSAQKEKMSPWRPPTWKASSDWPPIEIGIGSPL
jgi:hypothetical protein